MAITNADPTLVSDAVMSNLRKSLVWPGLCSTDYQGQIRGMGSSVNIITIAQSTPAAWSGSDISLDVQTDAATALAIDKAYEDSFFINAMVNVQSQPELVLPHLHNMGYGFANVIDQAIADEVGANVDSGNLISNASGNAIAITTAADAYLYLTKLGTKLNKANVPTQGRWVVVTPEFAELLANDTRFSTNSATAGMVTNGFLTQLAGFDVYLSNNCYAEKNGSGTVTGYRIVAGYNGATQFAGQLEEVTVGTPEKNFGVYGKGLVIFGTKLARATGVAAVRMAV